MDWLTDPQVWASPMTLTALEIILGVDNLLFIAIVAGRLPAERQNRARQVGLALALTTRLALLASIVWIIGLTRPLLPRSSGRFRSNERTFAGGTAEVSNAPESDCSGGYPPNQAPAVAPTVF
jgi:hypothetical protein